MTILKSDYIFENQEGMTSSSLRGLIDQKNYKRNTRFLSNYLAGRPTADETFCLGLEKRFTPLTSVTCASFDEALISSYRQLPSREVTVALSGGLDSQFLALDLIRRGFQVKAVTIKSNIPGYCEWDQTQRFALEHSLELVPIEVCREDFYQALPEMLKIVEEPIYNLHAVSKYLLAKGLKELGISRCMTGDGADQVFAAALECDLYRLTKKCFQAFGIDLLTPLATSAMVGFVSRHGPQDKRILYQMEAEKTSCFFPDEGKEKILSLSLEYLERNLLCVE
jgi:asparagine synthetase B (glutamine-hydrolysing)